MFHIGIYNACIQQKIARNVWIVNALILIRYLPWICGGLVVAAGVCADYMIIQSEETKIEMAISIFTKFKITTAKFSNQCISFIKEDISW